MTVHECRYIEALDAANRMNRELLSREYPGQDRRFLRNRIERTEKQSADTRLAEGRKVA